MRQVLFITVKRWNLCLRRCTYEEFGVCLTNFAKIYGVDLMPGLHVKVDMRKIVGARERIGGKIWFNAKFDQHLQLETAGVKSGQSEIGWCDQYSTLSIIISLKIRACKSVRLAVGLTT